MARTHGPLCPPPSTRRRDERGASLVEFALITPVLMALLFGIIQFGVYFWSMQAGADAARQAARLSAVGDPTDCTSFRSNVQGTLSGIAASIDAGDIDRSYKDSSGSPRANPSDVQVGDTVNVSVTFRAKTFQMPFVPLINGGQVTSTASARVENISPGAPSSCA